MEKLLDLLNEYEGYIDNPTWTLSGANEPLYGGWTAYASAYLIPSKKYGFIERLVKNDKIDFKSENYLLKSYDGYYDDDILCIVNQDCNSYEDRIKVGFDKIDSLLMILSIQDNPIEYLCSILKE